MFLCALRVGFSMLLFWTGLNFRYVVVRGELFLSPILIAPFSSFRLPAVGNFVEIRSGGGQLTVRGGECVCRNKVVGAFSATVLYSW